MHRQDLLCCVFHRINKCMNMGNASAILPPQQFGPCAVIGEGSLFSDNSTNCLLLVFLRFCIIYAFLSNLVVVSERTRIGLFG